MKTYTVKEISDALGTNQETVRRWIRAGKLQASQSTKKDGNEITEKSLIDFLKKNPKYSNIAAGSALLGGVFSALVPGVGPLLATLLTGHILSSDTLKNGQVNKESVKKAITDHIIEAETSIEMKRREIERLKKEIREEENRISDLRSVLEDTCCKE